MQEITERIPAKHRDWRSSLLRICIIGAAVITFGFLLFLVGHILIQGVPHISLDLFSFDYNSENLSLIPAAINTLLITILTLAIAVPLGVFTAIYLVEYAKLGNRAVPIIRVAVQTLAGIPSIVYGLFGLLFFVTALQWGLSLLAGAFTLSIMILPLIIQTSEEALRSISVSFREGSFALGAGKLRTIFRIVLPAAVPGILSGVILAIGRVVGETAALMYTAGTVAQVPSDLMSSGRTLALHMYSLSTAGLNTNKAYATAVVLLLIVVFINWLSSHIAKKVGKV